MRTGAFYENHFKDLLRYMMDQKQTVWELGGAEHDQYQRALDYVEAHGVQAQGSLSAAAPPTWPPCAGRRPCPGLRWTPSASTRT